MAWTTTHTQLLAPDELLEQSLSTLIERLDCRQNATERLFKDACLALEAMPLASAEFAQAKSNIQNAQHYVHSGEWRAAQYELRLLLRRFPRLLA